MTAVPKALARATAMAVARSAASAPVITVIASEGQVALTWQEVPKSQPNIRHECPPGKAIAKLVDLDLKHIAMGGREADVARCMGCATVWWRGDRAIAERAIELGVR